MHISLFQDGEEKGSFTLEEVNEMISLGSVNKSTKARHPETEELIELGEMSGLVFPVKKKKPPVLITKKKPPPLVRKRDTKGGHFQEENGSTSTWAKIMSSPKRLINICCVLLLLNSLIFVAYLWRENSELVLEREELNESIAVLDLTNVQLNDSKEALGNRLVLKDGAVNKLLTAINNARDRLDENDRRLKEANAEKSDLIARLEAANTIIRQHKEQSKPKPDRPSSIRDFVMKFYASSNSESNVDSILFYSGYAKHFGEVKSQRQIESEQKVLDQKWPNRAFVIHSDNVNIKRIPYSNRWIVKTRFTFEWKRDGERVLGTRDGRLLIEQTLRGEYQISEIDSEAVGIDQQIIKNATAYPKDGESGFMKTKDGKCSVWNNKYRANDIAHWSGAVDTDGYAIGAGNLTWSKSDNSNVKWSYFGNKVKGKFDGKITYKDEIKGGNGWGEYTNGIRSGKWSYRHPDGKLTTKSY